MIKVDLHSHTRHSKDSFTSISAVVRAGVKAGLGALAVTDHDEISGAFEVRDAAPFEVIVGEEIKTGEGEIIGLFLQEWIPPGLSAEETIAEIRRQRGLVYLPHPFDLRRNSSFTRERLAELAAHVDIVEVYNARNRDPAIDSRAEAFAREHGLLRGAGSDAHTPFEFGNAHLEMKEFDSPDTFLAALKSARVVGRRTPLWQRAVLNWKVRKALRRMSGAGPTGVARRAGV